MSIFRFLKSVGISGVTRLLNSKVLDGAIHEVAAGFPGRR